MCVDIITQLLSRCSHNTCRDSSSCVYSGKITQRAPDRKEVHHHSTQWAGRTCRAWAASGRRQFCHQGFSPLARIKCLQLTLFKNTDIFKFVHVIRTILTFPYHVHLGCESFAVSLFDSTWVDFNFWVSGSLCVLCCVLTVINPAVRGPKLYKTLGRSFWAEGLFNVLNAAVFVC